MSRRYVLMVIAVLLVLFASCDPSGLGDTGVIVVNLVGFEEDVVVTLSGPETFTLTSSQGVATKSGVPLGTYSASVPSVQPYAIAVTTSDSSIDTRDETITFTVTYTFAPTFAAVGENVLMYSTNGSEWSVNYVPTGDPWLYDICRGPDYFMAVGPSNSYYLSANGISWTSHAWGAEINGSEVYGVTYGGGYYEVVDSGQRIVYSTAASGPWSYYNAVGAVFRDVVGFDESTGEDYFFAVGYSGSGPYSLFSPMSSLSWSSNTNAAMSELYSACHRSADSFFAAGNDGKVAQYYDITSDVAASVGPGTSGLGIRGIAYGDINPGGTAEERTVIVGTGGAILWDDSNPSSSGWADVSPAGVTGTFNDVAYGEGIFVAVGDGGIIYRSTDGAVWTAISSGTTSRLNAVAYVVR